MTFDDELAALLDKARSENMPFNDLEAAVAELNRKHGREVPPPITGTIDVTEPEDSVRGG